MRKGARRAALLIALALLCAAALAETPEVFSDPAELFVGELEVFQLGDEAGAQASSDTEPEAPAAEPEAPVIEPEIPAAVTEVPVAKSEAPAEYVPEQRTLTVRSNASCTVNIGDTLTVTCAKGAFRSVTSADPSVAEVTFSDGAAGVATVVGRKAGRTRLKMVMPSGGSITVTLTVADPYVPTGVSLPGGQLTLNMGDTLTLTPTLTLAVARTTFTWKSSNPRVATVAGGVVTPVKEGSAKITVTTANGKKATASVTVVDPYKPAGVAFAQSTIAMNVGDSLTLMPVLSPESARTDFTWSSSRSRVAKVSGGAVEALSEGTAKITVKTANGKKATLTVNVADPYKPAAVRFEAASLELSLGDSLTLMPVLSPEGARTTYTWSSSAKRIAAVDGAGTVTGLAEGTANITVKTANGKKASVAIRVTDPRKPESVLLPASITIELNEAYSFIPVLSPSTASTTFTWSSSDSSRVTVQDGIATGRKLGSATVTVKTANGKTAACRVNVVDKTDFRALLVANNQFYDGGWERGSYNREAAERMRNALESVKTPLGTQYSVTVKNDLTLSQLKSAISSTFANADENDTSLFYFASHGKLDTGALVMASATAKTPETMSLKTLRDCLMAVPGKVIVILDTCGSGAAVYAKGSDGAIGEADLAAFNARVIDAFREADPGVYEHVSDVQISENGSLAKLGELRIVNKFYVLCSSFYREMSWAYVDGSFFTDWLCDGIGRSGRMPADTLYGGNRDGTADLYELFRYIAAVGDSRVFDIQGGSYSQHVQVYPADTRYPMFQ